jgi:hypothetical protein
VTTLWQLKRDDIRKYLSIYERAINVKLLMTKTIFTRIVFSYLDFQDQFLFLVLTWLIYEYQEKIPFSWRDLEREKHSFKISGVINCK